MKSPNSHTPTSAEMPRLTSRPVRVEKVAARHLERLAMVYVRQSTAQQLVRHQESTQVQYSLKLRAQDFGWPENRVIVIDEDLGKSGASIEGRSGFQRLVAEVTLDHVGIILGVDMSRLARSCKDWYQLLEVCAVFGTLIADLDGVYDPSQYNDRLLLGLKGTMSEAELHILKQRMSQGRLNKAKRGELIFHLPIGYVRQGSDGVALDPDEQAQQIVRLVFQKFEELSTLNAVLRFFVRSGVKLPVRAREGLNKGDLEWHRPNRMTLQNMLKNPIYAGAYTYGRRATDPRRKIPGRPATGRTVVAPEDCKVFLRDRFPAYISWDQYKWNQQRLKANRAVAEEVGAPKRGSALLSGLLKCSRCGCRMSVRYGGHTTKHSYTCLQLLSNYGQEYCQSLAGQAIDTFVSKHALKALEPASLELSLEAAANIEKQRHELDSLWKKRIERATYEADRAARSYSHVEPENRLVARQLERDWEEKLAQKKLLEEEYERFLRDHPRVLTESEQVSIRNLAANLPVLWEAQSTTVVDRKEILRQMIERIEVDVLGESECVKLTINWAGGIETHHEMVRPVARLEQLSYWPQLADRIRGLSQQHLKSAEIAELLNQEGWRPPKRREKFGAAGVKNLMQRLGLRQSRSRSVDQTSLLENEWWLPALARRLDMPEVTLYLWVRRGWLKARQSKKGRWIATADKKDLDRLRQLRQMSRGEHNRRRWTERPLEENNK